MVTDMPFINSKISKCDLCKEEIKLNEAHETKLVAGEVMSFCNSCLDKLEQERYLDKLEKERYE